MVAEIEGFLLKMGTALWEKITISNKTGSSNISNMFYGATVVASAAIFLICFTVGATVGTSSAIFL